MNDGRNAGRVIHKSTRKHKIKLSSTPIVTIRHGYEKIL